MADLIGNLHDDEEIATHNLTAAGDEDPRATLSMVTDEDGVLHVYVQAAEGVPYRIWHTEIEGVMKAEIRLQPVEA